MSMSQPSHWLSSQAAEEVDVVVVGGGIVGCSAAYWLGAGREKKRPGREGEGGAAGRLVLLDADGLATHASGRNAGFLMTGTPTSYVQLAAARGEATTRALWEVSRDNRELLRRELLDPGLLDCAFQPEGSWIAALPGTGQEEALQASCEKLTALGFEMQWRTAEEVRAASGSDRLGGAIYQPRDGGLDPVRLCRGLARLSGAEVRTGWRVRSIEPEGDRVLLVADAGRLLARRVVLATNAYTPALLPHLAGEIRPVRGQVLATAPGERDLPGVWYVNEGYEYLRQLPDGTLVLGGCRWCARETEVGFEETPTATVQGALDAFLRDAFPRFAGRPVSRRWAGIMAFTADGLPRIGEVPGIPGACYGAGMNGHGMSLGFVTGRHLARLAAGEEVAPLFPAAA